MNSKLIAIKPAMLPVSLALACLWALPAHADGIDPLWAKAVEQSKNAKKWIAQDIDMELEGSESDKPAEKTKLHMHLNGWDGTKPQYQVTVLEPKSPPSKDSKGSGDMDSLLTMADNLLKPNAKVKRVDGQTMDGKTWTVFELRESKTVFDITVKMWVDPESGKLHYVDAHLRGTLMFDADIKTNYVDTQQFGTVAKQTDFRIDVLIPFQNAKAHVASRSSNWIARQQ